MSDAGFPVAPVATAGWTGVGSTLIGSLLNIWLYGIVFHMYVTYWTQTSKDLWWLRLAVPALFIIDTAQTAADCYFAYRVAVDLDHPDTFTILAQWPLQFSAITQAMSALIVTLILIHRLYRLTKNNVYVAVVLSVYSVAVFCVGVSAGVKLWILNFLDFPAVRVANNLVVAWHYMELVLNTVITIGLIFVLSRSRTGFQRTDSLINTLMRGAMQTGFFTSFVSIIVVITWVRTPFEQSYFLIFILPFGRVYSVTLMDTVLTRQLIKQESSDHQSFPTSRVTAPTNTIELRVRKDVSVHYGDRRDSHEKPSSKQPKSTEADAASSLSNIV
ncbi:hypothetical protein EXIGLDRAFT_841845 [Exidia glandulosa HHB12029]|uniref:DUF6534 domain-containing protein n=1 Tax=Exidia glandulosa HHB12029 TaxID=1314781 RepID=A0A165ZQH8_EXIGL|nr:hypothetical protein EXIGLDRAFT_841845 [Exidia glandulosa HHB12029]